MLKDRLLGRSGRAGVSAFVVVHGLPAPRFARDLQELQRVLDVVKRVVCPHCGAVEALVGHGYLHGYAERGSETVVRGRRFLCSNRFRRPGCGRTFSVLLAHLLSRCIVGTELLLGFLRQLQGGRAVSAAWNAVATGAFRVQTGYRYLVKLHCRQASLRTRLLQRCPPPVCTSRLPLLQLAAHFERAFEGTENPLGAFQLTPQTPLMD